MYVKYISENIFSFGISFYVCNSKPKKMKKVFMVAITLLAITSCTDNERARNFGGTETIKLEPNEKFINITWKQDDIWVIVQDTVTKVYYAREKSSYGLMNGKIIIK